MKKQKQKVVIAMSGGVDSSVAAKMLTDQGYGSMGVFLHFWKPSYASSFAKAMEDKKATDGGTNFEKFENKCCSARAFMDARRVCQEVGIKLYTMNFSREFKKDIVDNFINEYKIGRTPNPCVRCNKMVKLGLLIKRAEKLGYDYTASGHYAKVKKTRKQENKKTKIIYKLYKAKDKKKDQSYFLWALTQEQLKHLLFPLGNFTKPEVRKMAKKFGLPVAKKKESQEICFIPEKSHNEFLKRYLKLKKGKIKLLKAPLDKEGKGDFKVIGEHQGLPLYTIGQRRGVEIGGTGPYYVAKLDYKTNTLYVVNNFDDPVLFSDKLIAKDVNWISGVEPKLPLKCDAVIRYRHTPVKCEVTKKTKSAYLIKFKKPQRAITPGQSVVFYKGNEVLGGGIIK